MSAYRTVVGGAQAKACTSLLRKASASSDGASTACTDSTKSDVASVSDIFTPRPQHESNEGPRQGELIAKVDARSAIEIKSEARSIATESEDEAPRPARRRRRRRGARRSAKSGTGETMLDQERTLTCASFQPNMIHEQAARTLLDLGLLVNVQPSLCSTDKDLRSMNTSVKNTATTRQVPRPMLLEQFLEFTPSRSPRMVKRSDQETPKDGLSEDSSFAQTPRMLWPLTPSTDKYSPQTPSMVWATTPYEERVRLRSPATLWPATPVGERDCPQTPSMLFPATPMAWPATEPGIRASSPKQDAAGHASIPKSWREAEEAKVPPGSLESGPFTNRLPSRLRSEGLLSPTDKQWEAHAAVDTLAYGQHEWTNYLMNKLTVEARQN